jgi:hypothetical protein
MSNNLNRFERVAGANGVTVQPVLRKMLDTTCVSNGKRTIKNCPPLISLHLTRCPG